MSRLFLKLLCCAISLTLWPGIISRAQEGGGDRDRPGGGYGNPVGRGPGGPEGPNAARGDRHPEATTGKVNNPPHNALQFGPVGRWWDNKTIVQAVGLRREQTKRMDAIFDANKPEILDRYKTFLTAQTNLATVNKNSQASKDQVFAAIDALNQARSSLQKATSAMLLQIRHEMDQDQINKLEKIH
jgi:hypothetical protein